ncbi:hypothetical protein HanIR_Chr13g0637211 [Helianthus annuus]|nr:hypothetical protein HanIR_Chr13g0637211 [Helianthus annuus]
MTTNNFFMKAQIHALVSPSYLFCSLNYNRQLKNTKPIPRSPEQVTLHLSITYASTASTYSGQLSIALRTSDTRHQWRTLLTHRMDDHRARPEWLCYLAPVDTAPPPRSDCGQRDMPSFTRAWRKILLRSRAYQPPVTSGRMPSCSAHLQRYDLMLRTSPAGDRFGHTVTAPLKRVVKRSPPVHAAISFRHLQLITIMKHY